MSTVNLNDHNSGRSGSPNARALLYCGVILIGIGGGVSLWKSNYPAMYLNIQILGSTCCVVLGLMMVVFRRDCFLLICPPRIGETSQDQLGAMRVVACWGGVFSVLVGFCDLAYWRIEYLYHQEEEVVAHGGIYEIGAMISLLCTLWLVVLFSSCLASAHLKSVHVANRNC